MSSEFDSMLKSDLIRVAKNQKLAIETRDKDIADLNRRLEKAETKNDTSKEIKSLQEKHSQDLKLYENELNKRNYQLEEALSAHEDLLKSMQGSLDMAIRSNSFMKQSLKGDKR